ncbi:hypothetical protein LJC30_04700 [Odoribacter sp. OttesenSCG-928-L07]|nr:hypothetical protein [Odoribacter sp. OttesenSCG-928-L07]
MKAYIKFCDEYLKYITDNLQAIIVSQNENHYQFFQYKKEGNFQITRPINSNLMYGAKDFSKSSKEFLKILKTIKTVNKKDNSVRDILNNATYTIQQSIGSALDGLPAGQSNTARKLNGDLFEHFIRLIIREIGIECKSGVIQLPVIVDGEPEFNMSYQHDLIIERDDDIKVIGSIKTSSKDRIDKIFIDKFLYNKLTEKTTPHIAIFLNDVQRKKTRKENEYGINATFLSGHFKGYTVKLNPLDGVYYCDIRPNMQTENILKDHIKTFDNLLIEDIWKFL